MKKRHISSSLIVITVVLLMSLCAFGCAPKTSSDSSSHSQEPVQQTTAWSIDMDCTVCHTAQAAATTADDTVAGIHVMHEGATCASCHADEAALKQVHANATADRVMPTQLKSTMVSCQSSGCHDLSKDEMLALTADVTELTDIEGTMVNPHDVIGLTPGHSEITCNSCHVMHDGTEVLAAETCVSCHHAGVYTCNTCH